MSRGKNYRNRPQEEWISTHVSVGLNTQDTHHLREACIATGTNGVEVLRRALRYFVANGCPPQEPPQSDKPAV